MCEKKHSDDVRVAQKKTFRWQDQREREESEMETYAIRAKYYTKVLPDFFLFLPRFSPTHHPLTHGAQKKAKI